MRCAPLRRCGVQSSTYLEDSTTILRFYPLSSENLRGCKSDDAHTHFRPSSTNIIVSKQTKFLSQRYCTKRLNLHQARHCMESTSTYRSKGATSNQVNASQSCWLVVACQIYVGSSTPSSTASSSHIWQQTTLPDTA